MAESIFLCETAVGAPQAMAAFDRRLSQICSTRDRPDPLAACTPRYRESGTRGAAASSARRLQRPYTAGTKASIPAEKIDPFHSYFHKRQDLFSKRWEKREARANEWARGRGEGIQMSLASGAAGAGDFRRHIHFDESDDNDHRACVQAFSMADSHGFVARSVCARV